MTDSKVVRVQLDALETALRYGNSIREGIRTMEKLLKEKDKKGGFDIEAVRIVVREELDSIGRY
jgi:hypothetical protein